MDPTLRRYRIVLGLFILGLALSGITAFPLLHELELLGRMLGIPVDARPDALTGLSHWIATVRDGLREVHGRYPWMAYGTDWLAFAHLIIALFFIEPWRNPGPNAWVLKTGLVACGSIFALAFICGSIRGIPIYWQLIDCSFGVGGAIPLLYCLRLTRKMELASPKKP